MDVGLATWLVLDEVDRFYDEAIVPTNDSGPRRGPSASERQFGPVRVISPHTLHQEAALPANLHW